MSESDKHVAEEPEPTPLEYYRSFRKAAATLGDEGKNRLRTALNQPIEEPGDSQIADWFLYLRGALPLWSLNREAFNVFYGPSSPVTYPLVDLVQSVARDEKTVPSIAVGRTLDMRRYHLMSGIHVVKNWGLEAKTHPDVTGSTAGAYWHEDMRPYADDWGFVIVGRDLIMHLESLLRARGKTERQEAQQSIKGFLKELLGTRRGRPSEGPNRDILRALVMEGRELFQLLWNSLAFDVYDPSRQLLRTLLQKHGQPESDANLRQCSLQLVLPLMSRPEILGLMAEAAAARSWTREGWRPSPRYFVVWVLARRLRMNPVTLAEKTMGSRDSEYFANKDNPIDTIAFSLAD
jgi:hypothetical protein